MQDDLSLSYGEDDEDPVRTVWRLPRFRLSGMRYTGRLDHALVCVTRNGSYETFPPPERPRTVRRYAVLYEVDTAPHAFRLTAPLPSRVDSFEFEAAVDVTWRVADPERFVRSQERDVPGLLARELLPEMRRASRGHHIEASAEAEAAVQQAVHGSARMGGDKGLDVACAVRLRRDAVERSHQDRLRTARHEEEAAVPEHRAALRRGQHEAALRAERIRFYEAHLARGDVAALALHLAAHPDDTQGVLAHLSKQQAELLQNQLHLIDQAVADKRLEGYLLEGPNHLIADRMTAILRAGPPSEHASAPSPAPAERPELPLVKDEGSDT
ncbi:hypothetical protein [Streptomyces sp. NPDC001450]